MSCNSFCPHHLTTNKATFTCTSQTSCKVFLRPTPTQRRFQKRSSSSAGSEQTRTSPVCFLCWEYSSPFSSFFKKKILFFIFFYPFSSWVTPICLSLKPHSNVSPSLKSLLSSPGPTSPAPPCAPGTLSTSLLHPSQSIGCSRVRLGLYLLRDPGDYILLNTSSVHLHTNPLKPNAFIISILQLRKLRLQGEWWLVQRCSAHKGQRQDSVLKHLIPETEFLTILNH